MEYITANEVTHLSEFVTSIRERLSLNEWKNIGGQLVPEEAIGNLIADMHSGKVKCWDEIHDFYIRQGKQYPFQKLLHALAALDKIMNGEWREDPKRCLMKVIESSIKTKGWMTEEIEKSREKTTGIHSVKWYMKTWTK